MPNWCENNLRIYASKETKQKMLLECISKDEHDQDRLDFEKLIPIGDVTEWYEQHIERWGTKWNSTDCYIGEVDDYPLIIDMMTAWSPPIPILSAICQKYHCDARLEYYEGGVGFRGVAEAFWRDGEVIQTDDCWDMTKADLEELGLVEPSEIG